jgi:hypothetical protein
MTPTTVHFRMWVAQAKAGGRASRGVDGKVSLGETASSRTGDRQDSTESHLISDQPNCVFA